MRAILLCALLLAGQAHLAAQPASSGSTLTPSEFVSELDKLTAGLANASLSDVSALSAGIPLRWRVSTGTNEIVVDGTWIIHALRDAAAAPAEWTSRRKQLAARLAEIRAHAADQADGDSLTAARQRVRSAAGAVLERNEFQSARQSWLAALQEAIGEWIRALLDRLGAGGAATRLSAVVLAWIAGIAAFAGLGVWLAHLLGRPRRGVALGLARKQPPHVSAREWTSRAIAAFRSGDVREAMRCAYNAAIRRVEEQGAWRVDHARTPREYLPLLPPDDSRRPPVSELTEKFEQVWYGNRTVTEDDIRSITTNLEKLGCLPAAERAT